MKISTTRLRRIIAEELTRVNESRPGGDLLSMLDMIGVKLDEAITVADRESWSPEVQRHLLNCLDCLEKAQVAAEPAGAPR